MVKCIKPPVIQLTSKQVWEKLGETDWTTFTQLYNSQRETGRKNKGLRGQCLEKVLGIPNGSNLMDMTDGELKTYTVGQSIKCTMLSACLPHIIDDNGQNRLFEKMNQVIYVAFNKSGGYVTHAKHQNHRDLFEQDYHHICDVIRAAFHHGKTIREHTKHSTVTGPNKILQIRTADTKRKGIPAEENQYHALKYKDVVLNDKNMAFYLRGKFGITLCNL